jgi:hypothetical protein
MIVGWCDVKVIKHIERNSLPTKPRGKEIYAFHSKKRKIFKFIN